MSTLCENNHAKIKLSLIALGNRNMGDDGIGLMLVEAIRKDLSKDIEIHFWETKDPLYIAAELLEIKHPVVIVDCADMGLNGGEFRWFKRSDALFEYHFELLSSHGFGFAEALALIEELGFCQPLYFFAIQPFQTNFELSVSDALQNNIPVLAGELLTQLKSLTIN